MAIFSKHEIIAGNSKLIPEIAKEIRDSFLADGFDVTSDELVSGGYDISITKGNLFKAVLGMRTALKVTLTPHTSGMMFEANVGIYGQQAIPTIISMFFFWPVIISQIWGLVEQSKLDDKALAICKDTIIQNANSKSIIEKVDSQPMYRFCTDCGKKILMTAKYCPECGSKTKQ
ncbi:MAG: zinc-ribbon domain-containing protein [Prevotellaceae bacterium]|nr:zinc-ribbon domain-containing protein [Candidatus Colivivens equi]